jgi:hypothetical protein
MTTTADVKVTPGSGANVATYSISEDSETKQLQRIVLSTSAGAEVDFTSASPVTQSGAWSVGLSAGSNAIGKVAVGAVDGREYETVAASQSDQPLGATGAAGDDLDGLLIVPGSTAAGAVSIKDGAGSAITVFAGATTTALVTLIPFFIPLGLRSTGGAWTVTTGANVAVIAVGNFT